MARQKNERYATDAELGWFDLSTYGDLRGTRDSNGDTVINLALWAAVIRDRVELSRFLDAGETAYVIALFEKIKTHPLKRLGFEKSYSGTSSPTDTPTVKSITTKRVHWLNDAMLRTGARASPVVDDLLLEDEQSAFADYAHVMVNLQATDEQICANFKSWLQEWRKRSVQVTAGNYRDKAARWAQSQVIPFTDLELFMAVTGKSIRVSKKFEMLFPHTTHLEKEARRSQFQKMEKPFFTDLIASIFERLAENEPAHFREKLGG